MKEYRQAPFTQDGVIAPRLRRTSHGLERLRQDGTNQSPESHGNALARLPSSGVD